ncbi:hypothetical protein [Microcoleus sp. FACHB-831]|uniref:hypothetical protein n=1 Tax=Microcoleus sp. FACHB-831 TaxID=2692827 RepID=UPI0016860425|nr:hypothetical protein [Microcoleus sp. FACHB-831]
MNSYHIINPKREFARRKQRDRCQNVCRIKISSNSLWARSPKNCRNFTDLPVLSLNSVKWAGLLDNHPAFVPTYSDNFGVCIRDAVNQVVISG